jgi:hypothetical protein
VNLSVEAAWAESPPPTVLRGHPHETVEVAAHLTDRVMPELPVRQCVLSATKGLRPYLHHRPTVASGVLHVFLRAVRATLAVSLPRFHGRVNTWVGWGVARAPDLVRIVFATRPTTPARIPRTLTGPAPARTLIAMRPTRPVRTLTAACLLILMGVLSTGLPSHHHDDPGRAGAELRLVSSDHHSHGTQLVEQDDGAPSATPELVARIVQLVEPRAPVMASMTPASVHPIRPTERAPPPHAPRAPPVPA